MFGKKIKWYPIFASEQELDDLFVGRKAFHHKTMFIEAIFIKEKGEYYAFKNKCPHQGKPLEDCSVENGSVVCPFHRYQFSLQDGRGHGLCLDKYHIKIENEQVWLGMEKWSLF